MSAGQMPEKEIWGKLDDGREVVRYTVKGDKLCANFINLGAAVQRLTYDGMDIIFSLPDAATCAKFSRGCMGAIVGRYAGRIAGGHLEIDGQTYQLPINERNYHLHGGVKGFNTRLWESEAFSNENGAGVIFKLLSPDGDEGYPGNLDVAVKYTVTRDDQLRIDYTAHTDKATAVNLTNHCYFNLNGMNPVENTFPHGNGSNSDIEMKIDADYITELHEYIPTGRLLDVTGTPFDFRQGKIISDRADEIADIEGYDHNFVLNSHALDKPSVIAKSLSSGIIMECYTDRPGVQLFSLGCAGSAFALETQLFPDSPNHPSFPNSILRPYEELKSTTIYKFNREI